MKHFDPNLVFTPADILIPDPSHTDLTRWSVVACDQFTAEPAYWEAASEFVGEAPSTLSMILPEVYLSERDARTPRIHAAMEQALAGPTLRLPESMVYLERTQSDGRIRRGLIGKLDLDAYDYAPDATSPVRATEGTVTERLPPRIRVRRGAALELPHAMLLCDDPSDRILTAAKQATLRAPLYDFDLMMGGGHVKGFALTPDEIASVQDTIANLASSENQAARYGGAKSPLLFAVGDGNHSLATAKEVYEELKQAIGEEAAKAHPLRYALCELVNLHDPALDFEPIYRLAMHVDPTALLDSLRALIDRRTPCERTETLHIIMQGFEETVSLPLAPGELVCGALDTLLAQVLSAHPESELDYIHGEESLRALAAKEGFVGFLFEGLSKSNLFSRVLTHGPLPRKAFSMGQAADKRYYLEFRALRA